MDYGPFYMMQRHLRGIEKRGSFRDSFGRVFSVSRLEVLRDKKTQDALKNTPLKNSPVLQTNQV